MKLTNREVFTVAISIIIISSILYFVYFYRPIISETENLMDQLIEIRSFVTDSQDLDVKLQELNDELIGLNSELNFLSGEYFEGIEQAEIILFFEKLIKPFGTEKSIAFIGMEDYGAYKVARVVLRFETNYSSLKMILEKIEQSPWKNRIEKMNAVRRNTDDSTEYKYDMEVEMTIGFYCL